MATQVNPAMSAPPEAGSLAEWNGGRQRIELDRPWMVLGRCGDSALCWPDNSELSRQHCAFEFTNGQWTVQDLGSRNGTFVNGALLKGPHLLLPGDRIATGNLLMVYESGGLTFETTHSPSRSTERVVCLEAVHPAQTLVVQSGPLEALLRAGHELSEQQPLAELIPSILDLALMAVGAQRGALLLVEDGALVVKASCGDCREISRAVRDRVLLDQTALLVRDVRGDPSFQDRESLMDLGLGTLMAAPLRGEDRFCGMLYVDSPVAAREFTEDDLRLLSVMANVATIRIEQARLREIERADQKLQAEVQQAAEIQRCVLPARAPAVAGIEAAGYNLPCRTVGGDYYGFFSDPHGRLGIALGDVSGKGMPAALMMMALDARVQVLAEELVGLDSFMARLNRSTCHRYPSNRFITFAVCVLDPVAGEMRCANAGHGAPIVVRASGQAETIEEASLVLGILPEETYREVRVPFGDGDLVALYSDGITEAVDSTDEEFGVERLTEVLIRHRTEPVGAIVEAVTRALSEFAGGAALPDDVTLVVAKRVSAAAGPAR